MDAMLTVVAQEGCLCPRENPRDPRITDSEPVQVPSNLFYRRLIADGSLRLVSGLTEPAESGKKKNGGSK